MATYNLLREPWILARTRGGERRWIAPHQITEPDLVAIDTGRPDFDGALMQFLIGLLQTCAAPDDFDGWEGWLMRPPSVDEIRQRFARYEEAFWLDGDGPRYLQELNFPLVDAPVVDGKGKSKPGKELPPCPIAWLLMDAPTENAIELNKDFFVTRDRVHQLAYPAVAAALTVLQMNASGGGPGYRTSLRSGGPLTTLVDLEGASLWMRLWLNVLTAPVFLSKGGDPKLDKPEHIFPWMGKTRTSDDESGVTTIQHVHPAHQFWAMPWRLFVEFTGEQGSCDVLPSAPGPVVQRFYKRNYGFNYKGEWRHPLTPYVVDKKGQGTFARTVGEDGIPYRDWPALTLGDQPGQLSARVVSAFLEEQRSASFDEEKRSRMHLHAFGYEMDNAKARVWLDQTTPLLTIKPALAADLYPQAARLVDAAQNVLFTLRQQVKRAVKRRPEDTKKDIPELVPAFWATTEPAFFATCRELVTALEQGRDHATVRERWLKNLHDSALALFGRHSQELAAFSAADVKRVATAHNDLKIFTHPSGKKLRELVGLPPLGKDNPGDQGSKPARAKKGKK